MASAVDQVWLRFAEMFGASTLKNKFGETPPETWRQAVAQLNEYQLKRGMQRSLRFTKGVPSLPEFLRMCREVSSEMDDAPTLPPVSQLTHAPMPRWEREANDHLRAYLARQGALDIHYCTERMRRYPMPRDVDHESRALMQPLIDAKAAWAEDMRDAEMAGNIPADNGRELWFQCMRNAESVVAIVRAEAA